MVWIILVLAAIYTVMAWFVDTQYLLTLMHATVFFVAATVVVYYLPTVIPTIIRGRGTREECLILGIVLAWSSTGAVRLWSSVYRVLDRPAWMYENAVFGFLLLAGIVGGVMHLTALHVVDGRVPPRRWLDVAVILGLGVLSAAALVWLDAAYDFDFASRVR